MRLTWNSKSMALVLAACVAAVGSIAQGADLSVKAELSQGRYNQNEVAKRALVVTASEKTSTGVTVVQGVEVMVRVTSGDAWLRTPEDSYLRALKVSTDVKGEAVFDLKLGAADKAPTLQIEATRKVAKADGSEETLALRPEPTQVTLEVIGYEGQFLSPKVATEVLLGVVFQDRYKEQPTADGKGTESVAEGFKDRRFLAQVSFDTLWPKANHWTCFSSKETPRRCSWHTGLSLRFSSFPIAQTETTTGATQKDDATPKTFSDVADSLTGNLYGVFIPPGWSRYPAVPSKENSLHDAFQLGFIVKAGLITRDRVRGDTGDTVDHIYSAGLRFTHHQTTASSLGDDDRNVIPLRFVELCAVRFDEYAGRRNEWRGVFEAAFRLPVLGEGLPFYGGISANFGHGPDDIRLFAALVFKLDRIPTFLGL
jgi:hypothetical protein